MAVILECKNVTKNFSGLVAVNDLTFQAMEGHITSIIGPNGAGKSTTLNLLTKVIAPTSGKVLFNGEDILSRHSHELIKQGMARTYQNVHLFKSNGLTVLDNVKIGLQFRYPSSFFSSGLRLKSYRDQERQMTEESFDILRFLGIDYLAERKINDLPFGNLRLVELARALAAKPKLLILDEPAAGLNDAETEKLAETFQAINRKGVSILLVEHHMELVMNISDRIIVLNYGSKLSEGTPKEIKKDKKVIEAYLGEGEEKLAHA